MSSILAEIIRLKNSSIDLFDFRLIDLPFLFVNLWSFVHLIMGGVVMFLLQKVKLKQRYLFLFNILLIWEILELVLIILSRLIDSSLSLGMETNLDIFYDIIYGMLGGFLFHKVFKKNKFNPF